MIENIKSKISKISKKNWIIIILSAIALMMLLFNILTPILGDDFSYSLGVDDKRIKNILDIYKFQVHHYFNWGGRSIAHTIAQLFLLLPKWVFSLCNTAVFIGTIYLMYLHAKGNRKDNPIILIITYLLVWFLSPVFGQTFLWLVGSCNYLWTTFFILLFLLPYRNTIDKDDNIWMIIGMFLLGVLSGWTNENSAVGLIVISILFVIVRKINHKKDKLKKWNISGIVGALIGFVIMIAAPGNYVRKEALEDNTFFIIKWIRRIISYSNSSIERLFPLIIICIVAVSIYVYYKKKTEISSYIYLVGAFFSIYSMVLSPSFPGRAWTGVIIFAIIGTMTLLFEVGKLNKVFNFIMCDLILIFGIIYLKQYVSAADSIYSLNSCWRYRNKYILSERKNNKNIILGKFYVYDSKNPSYGLADIEPDENFWQNKTIAKYYEIDTIKSPESEES